MSGASPRYQTPPGLSGEQNVQGVSVIVPTWNEAPWLPSLIHRLESTGSVKEIIVADNDSDDDTVGIALAHGCRIVPGGRPAAGRNAGADLAGCDVLVFVDADVVIVSEIVSDIVRQFEDESCVLVHFRLATPSNRLLVRTCYAVADAYARITAKLGRTQASAPLIAVRREAFFTVGGFDETLSVAEDVDFISRVRRCCGGVRYVREPALVVSSRRFELESGLLYTIKVATWAFLRLLGLRPNIFSYKWVPYPVEIAARDAAIDVDATAVQLYANHRKDS